MARLKQAEQFKFMAFLQSAYTKSGLKDAEFAALATEHVGTEINRDQVVNARASLGIESNHPHGHPKDSGGGMSKGDVLNILNELAELQKLVRTLEKRIDVYFNAGR